MANFSFPLFKNTYKNRDTQPDLRSQVTLEEEQINLLKEILQKVKGGDTVALDFAAWSRTSSGGKDYYSCSFSITPDKYRKDNNNNEQRSESNSASSSNMPPDDTPF